MLDANDPLNYTGWITHRLAIALRFVDVFTRRPIDIPLSVTIPELGWQAVHQPLDSTYRFLLAQAESPSGTFQVLVEEPDRRYINHGTIQVGLPWSRATSGLARADYLEEYVLWPTRGFRAPPGETVLIGRLTSLSAAAPVDDLDVILSPGVRLFPPPDGLPPEIPFARSNPQGEFQFRLPDVFSDRTGDPVPAAIGVEVRRRGAALHPITPASFEPEPGRVRFVTFQIP